MIAFQKATIITATFASFIAVSHAAPLPLPAQVEAAARAELDRQLAAGGLTEPQVEVAVVNPRPAPPCTQPVDIEPLDTRSALRMRFLARCADVPGWRYEVVVRARVTAMVAVAAGAVAPNDALTDAQVTLDRRDVSGIADALGNPQDAVGKMSRRALRPGDILRSGQLASPTLVKRGDAVLMVARRDGIEVSTAGAALDAGAQGAIVRVRNAGSGQGVRMRVAGAGTVEPIDVMR
jgi:flagella basal body P-ring formation protein FlgA